MLCGPNTITVQFPFILVQSIWNAEKSVLQLTRRRQFKKISCIRKSEDKFYMPGGGTKKHAEVWRQWAFWRTVERWKNPNVNLCPYYWNTICQSPSPKILTGCYLGDCKLAPAKTTRAVKQYGQPSSLALKHFSLYKRCHGRHLNRYIKNSQHVSFTLIHEYPKLAVTVMVSPHLEHVLLPSS